jgi:hypothetical protein
VLNGFESVGNAVLHNPGDVALSAAGMGLTALSASGEAGGMLLNATGIGAVIGVPADALAASGMVAGASMMGAGASDWATTRPRTTTWNSSSQTTGRRPK